MDLPGVVLSKLHLSLIGLPIQYIYQMCFCYMEGVVTGQGLGYTVQNLTSDISHVLIFVLKHVFTIVTMIVAKFGVEVLIQISQLNLSTAINFFITVS